jgi:spore maturation protein CgeB
MKLPKLVIIGSDQTAALEITYQGILVEAGYSVSIFPAQTLFLTYYNYSIFNKLIYRLGFSRIIAQIQRKIKDFILANKPSIVLVFKGMEIRPDTVIWMKNQGITLLNYNPDHPFIFSGKGSGNKNLSNSIKLYDYYFSYAEDAVKSLLEMGVKSVKIPFGFEHTAFEYHELSDSEHEIQKVCFLGNADKNRVFFINQLAKMGLPIDVYGENWQGFNLESSISVNSGLYGQAFWSTLQKYAVQLNLLRPHNFNTHNMRSFDIPGAGGIMLAPHTKDHATFYKEGKEVFLFNDLTDSFRIAKSILAMTFEQRQEIRKLARIKSLGEHTYKHRVLDLMKAIDVELPK